MCKERTKHEKTCIIISLLMALMLSINAIAATMGAVYAGSGVSTTGADLEFTYTKSQTKYWYPAKYATNGMYCAATVKCVYTDGLLKDYDKCQVTGLPPNGLCCFAGVQNLSGTESMAFTSAVSLTTDGVDTVSSVAKVTHVGSNVKFTITFGSVE